MTTGTFLKQLLNQLPIWIANGPTTDWPKWEDVALILLLFATFVTLSAFFIVAEFAIIRVRLNQLREEEGKNPKRIARAIEIKENLKTYHVVGRVGATLAALALGFIGGGMMASMIESCLQQLQLPWEAEWVRTVSFTIAYLIIAFFLITLGEMIPKALAVQFALPATLTIARPLQLFQRALSPFIWVLHQFSHWVLRFVFRVEPEFHYLEFHSSEELSILISQSERSDAVTSIESQILSNTLELNDRCVRDVITPRADVVCMDIRKSFRENLEIAVKSGHTRFPLVDGHLDNTLGMIHVKDLFKNFVNEEEPSLDQIRKRKMVEIPEMMKLDQLLPRMQKEHSAMALVVDEFGGSQGVVTLDNVIEEVVGDIQDEFDNEAPAVRWMGSSQDVFFVEGKLPLYELAEHTDIRLSEEDVTSVGGFIVQQLGTLPTVGQELEIMGYKATVTRTDGRRVMEVRFERKPAGTNEESIPDSDSEPDSSRSSRSTL